jgi:hypothetical protein
MRPLVIIVATMTGTALGTPVGHANSEDASWGCQVLLCAASQKSVLARRCLLRSTYDKAHSRDEATGIFLANLP